MIKNNKTTTFDTCISELSLQIAEAAKMLGTNTEELFIMTDRDRDHMYFEQFKDDAIKVSGFRKDLPFIHFDKDVNATRESNGYGLSLHRTKTDSTLRYHRRYVMLHIPSESKETIVSYFICNKKDVEAIEEYWGRIDLSDRDVVPTRPILEDVFLNDITDSSLGFLLRADELEKYKVKLRRGILLDGPPGNGKTMTLRYIKDRCSQEGIRFHNITATDLMAAFRDNQLEALMSSSPVLFFDDIDVSFFNRNRTEGGDGRMCCALLSAMDGMRDTGHCVRIFTTNEPVSEMDPAFKRPGRIDRVFQFKKPTNSLRAKLIQTWNTEILEGVDFEDLLTRTKDFSFAETDSIKDLLVTNKVFGDKTWSLDKAFEMYHGNKESQKELEELSKEVGYKQEDKKDDDSIENVLKEIAGDSPVFPSIMQGTSTGKTPRTRRI